jgi:hypothetical protein
VGDIGTDGELMALIVQFFALPGSDEQYGAEQAGQDVVEQKAALDH